MYLYFIYHAEHPVYCRRVYSNTVLGKMLDDAAGPQRRQARVLLGLDMHGLGEAAFVCRDIFVYLLAVESKLPIKLESCVHGVEVAGFPGIVAQFIECRSDLRRWDLYTSIEENTHSNLIYNLPAKRSMLCKMFQDLISMCVKVVLDDLVNLPIRKLSLSVEPVSLHEVFLRLIWHPAGHRGMPQVHEYKTLICWLVLPLAPESIRSGGRDRVVRFFLTDITPIDSISIHRYIVMHTRCCWRCYPPI